MARWLFSIQIVLILNLLVQSPFVVAQKVSDEQSLRLFVVWHNFLIDRNQKAVESPFGDEWYWRGLVQGTNRNCIFAFGGTNRTDTGRVAIHFSLFEVAADYQPNALGVVPGENVSRWFAPRLIYQPDSKQNWTRAQPHEVQIAIEKREDLRIELKGDVIAKTVGATGLSDGKLEMVLTESLIPLEVTGKGVGVDPLVCVLNQTY